MHKPKRILLGHLSSNGDCLYATAIARQIKHDHPGCHLTWAVGSPYRQAVDGNPYVDEIWEIPIARTDQTEIIWNRFEHDVKQRQKAGDFDEVFLTQINPNNYQNFDGTVRSSTFRAYPRRITVPIQPTIRLRPEEVAHVRRFVGQHRLDRYKHVVLFECASKSGQSFLTPAFGAETAEKLLERLPDCAIILSSNIQVVSHDERIIDGSVLPFRENAELTKYCTVFIGCSSGVSWLATSDWAKPLPMIQVLNRATSVFASMCHDAEYFGLPTSHIIEMTDCSSEHLADCVYAVLIEGVAVARSKFHEQIPVKLDFYLERFMKSQLRQGHLLKTMRSLSLVLRRYGPLPFLQYLFSKIP